MRTSLPGGREVPAAIRVAVAAPAGAAAAAIIGVNAGWKYAPAAGWIAGAVVYLSWTWMVAGRMSPQQTAAHATRADTTGSMTDAIVVSASTVSLAGVGYLLVAESAKGGEVYGAAAVGIGSVVVSWVAIHTVFTLRYARLYYSGTPGGIDFNQPEPPAYVDFAYLAFTNSTPRAPVRDGQAALIAADAPARPRRKIVATDTRRRTATSTRRLHRPVGVVAWLPPHSTRRSPFLEIEINRFEVGVDPIARVGDDAQCIFQVVDQGAKATLSSGRDKGAYLRIRRHIFGREVFFSRIVTPR